MNEYGSAYMMEKMAFKSTENRSRETMVKYDRYWIIRDVEIWKILERI